MANLLVSAIAHLLIFLAFLDYRMFCILLIVLLLISKKLVVIVSKSLYKVVKVITIAIIS